MKYLLVVSARELAIIQCCVEQCSALSRLADGQKTFVEELDALIREFRSRPKPFGGFEVKGGVDA